LPFTVQINDVFNNEFEAYGAGLVRFNGDRVTAVSMYLII